MKYLYLNMIGAILCASLLGGCQSAPSNACPTLVDYTQEEMRMAAAEINSANLPELTSMLSDYAALREQVRVCK